MATRKTRTTNGTASETKTPPRRKRTSKASIANGGSVSPTADQIRVRAYELYLERGGGHGNDLDDWFAAERELSSAASRST